MSEIKLSKYNARSIIAQILYLENNIGLNYKKDILDPRCIGMRDCSIESIRYAAKYIANYINIRKSFVVTIDTSMKKKYAGGVDRGIGGISHIQISQKYLKSEAMVLSILAHELCHIYLVEKGLRGATEIQNEALTDLTTIYTGLGVITLNGCKQVSTKIEQLYDGQRETTTTTSIGYFNIDAYAFAYELICYARNIDTVYFEKLISRSSSGPHNSINVEIFNNNYIMPFTHEESIKGFIKETVKKAETIDNKIDKLSKRNFKNDDSLLKKYQETKTASAKMVDIVLEIYRMYYGGNIGNVKEFLNWSLASVKVDLYFDEIKSKINTIKKILLKKQLLFWG